MLCRVFCLGLLVFGTVVVAGAAWPGQVEADVSWQSNVTNADRPGDRLGGWSSRWSVGGGTQRMFAHRTGVLAGWRLQGERWRDYRGLDSFTASPTVGLRHKFGLGAWAPVLSTTVTGGWTGVREAPRSGWGATVRVEVRQRLNESMRVAVAHEWSRFDARGLAFRNTGQTTTVEGDFQWGARWHGRLGASYRTGDVVSYSRPPRPDLVKAGKKLTLVDTFGQEVPLLAYYFPAETRGLHAEISRQLGDRWSVFGRWDALETTHKAVRYRNENSTLGVRWRW